MVRRLGAYWRNVIRIRADFAPQKIDFDAYDPTPLHRRENKNELVATVGGGRVGAKEDNAGEQARHTAILYSSSDGVSNSPEVRFKATGPGSIMDIT